MGYLLSVFGKRAPCARKPVLHVAILAVGTVAACLAMSGTAGAASSKGQAFDLERFVKAGIRKEAIQAALQAYAARRDKVKRPFLTLIDYALHSSKPRMFIIDMNKWEVTKALRVAHGKGSDPDHDGFADRFSNIPNSKMSSLGAFITANAYHGKHGLAMRLIGLEESNNAALKRAIVMHGASYVSKQGVGRSWGCPSIEKKYVKEVIPALANGAFLYITR